MLHAFQVAQWVKKLSAMQETLEIRIWSLGWEASLEEGAAAHSSILAWRISWTEEPGGYIPSDHKELDTTEATELSTWDAAFKKKKEKR